MSFDWRRAEHTVRNVETTTALFRANISYMVVPASLLVIVTSWLCKHTFKNVLLPLEYQFAEINFLRYFLESFGTFYFGDTEMFCQFREHDKYEKLDHIIWGNANRLSRSVKRLTVSRHPTATQTRCSRQMTQCVYIFNQTASINFPQ